MSYADVFKSKNLQMLPKHEKNNHMLFLNFKTDEGALYFIKELPKLASGKVTVQFFQDAVFQDAESTERNLRHFSLSKLSASDFVSIFEHLKGKYDEEKENE